MNYKAFVRFIDEDIECLCISDKRCAEGDADCGAFILRLDPINTNINKLEESNKKLSREIDKLSKISKKLLR